MNLVKDRDRLMRLGFGFPEAALAAQSRSIFVVEPNKMADDIVRPLQKLIRFPVVRGFAASAPLKTAPRRFSKQWHEEAPSFHLPGPFLPLTRG